MTMRWYKLNCKNKISITYYIIYSLCVEGEFEIRRRGWKYKKRALLNERINGAKSHYDAVYTYYNAG
jgi:hypothetical protein